MIASNLVKMRVRVSTEGARHLFWLFVDGERVMGGVSRREMMRLAVEIRRALDDDSRCQQNGVGHQYFGP